MRYEITAIVFIIYEVTLFVLFVGNFIRGLFLNNKDYTFQRLAEKDLTKKGLDEEDI